MTHKKNNVTKKLINNQKLGFKDLESLINLSGMMSFIQKTDGMLELDFNPDNEAIIMTAYTAKFKVQIMHDGTVQISELKKRRRNKPIFREDHSSLSLGFDGIYYFNFRLPKAQVEQLPDKLRREAIRIAQKVSEDILNQVED